MGPSATRLQREPGVEAPAVTGDARALPPAALVPPTDPEARTMGGPDTEPTTKQASTTDRGPTSDRLDPGADIGSEPEREAETIPGGVQPGDERIAAHDAAPGVPGEPGRSWGCNGR